MIGLVNLYDTANYFSNKYMTDVRVDFESYNDNILIVYGIDSSPITINLNKADYPSTKDMSVDLASNIITEYIIYYLDLQIKLYFKEKEFNYQLKEIIC